MDVSSFLLLSMNHTLPWDDSVARGSFAFIMA